MFIYIVLQEVAWILSRPCFVLCTGDALLERISPQVIVLDSPEKLFIETRASGGYHQFDWVKNGNAFTLAQGQPFTVMLQEFSNFFEIFVREPSSTNDLGVYEVDLHLIAGPQAPEIEFAVISYSKYILSSYHLIIMLATSSFYQGDCRPSG